MEARSCTLVLVGPRGQGKSSTGNSILGRMTFSVKQIYSGEPSRFQSEEKSTLADGNIWKVIDTPDELLNNEEFDKLVCGRDLHAFLVVFSLSRMFLEEEQVAYLERLRDGFGKEIFQHTVVVFTNADVLEEDGVTLDDYLQSRPKLKDLLGFCQERRVLLENRSADATKKQSQVENLWHSVDTAVQHNGGRPYKYEGTIRIKEYTLLLIGKSGNGKSATGNCILGCDKFLSQKSASPVTSKCEMATNIINGRYQLNVVDTPDPFLKSLEELAKSNVEFKKEFHAIIVVLTLKRRCLNEEIEQYQSLALAAKFTDYLIIVFAGADDIPDDERGNFKENLKLRFDGSGVLMRLLASCDNRFVLFDNKTTNKEKKEQQVNSLLGLVDRVAQRNKGKAYGIDHLLEGRKNPQPLVGQQQNKDPEKEDHYTANTKLKKIILKKDPAHFTLYDNTKDDMWGLATFEIKRIQKQVGADIPEASKIREGKVGLESASSLQTEDTKEFEKFFRLTSCRLDRLESQVTGVQKEIDELRWQPNVGVKELQDRVLSLEGRVHDLLLTTNPNSMHMSSRSAAAFDNRSSRCPPEGHAYGYWSSGSGADPFHPDPHPSRYVSGGGEFYGIHDTDEHLLAAHVAQGSQYSIMTSSSCSPFPDGGGNQDPACKCSRKDQRRHGRWALHQPRLWGHRST